MELLDWFDALNKSIRFQLTAIGVSGPNLSIAEEISAAVLQTTVIVTVAVAITKVTSRLQVAVQV